MPRVVRRLVPRPAAEVADQAERVVEHVLRRLRRGQNVVLPGIGRLLAGREPGFEPKQEVRRGGN